ncbi:MULTISPECIES: hypothetical protein [unclassified Robiginitalea]|uniref:hypothetical protein n=1 Tax=Robiginitalea TaxID=252306 RepID=UPI00234B3787|nr:MULTISPECIES: hypothetical protein [unclassified Robiginitalea]MDC6353749.1 hypothetical protein [Robiginitalea sp. PM2]MDC6375823.1 hypothetical protein [Robiginitalea sp. SP8]
MSFSWLRTLGLLFGILVIPHGINAQYICKPCNAACDTLAFARPGSCHGCGMQLIPGTQEVADPITLEIGHGNFLVRDSRDPSKRIRVFYYRPESYSVDSDILIVIPGTGRNADEYREAWVQMSEAYQILVVSPSFNEMYYDFEDYHLGALVHSSNLTEAIRRIEGTNRVELDESRYAYKVQPEEDQWIFSQFDQIFDKVKEATGSVRETYDLFGHSAGGHILHRMALFYTGSKANRILASNASFYTLPTEEYNYPFGIGNIPFGEAGLAGSFENHLVVFLGGEDNADETGGTFLVSESANRQGKHRLERGRYFYKMARQVAGENGMHFNWKLVTIPGVGHNHSEMSAAAGEYLYGVRD